MELFLDRLSSTLFLVICLDVPGSADYIADAWEKNCSYDEQMNGLMGQYKVKREEREEEVVTGHVWSRPKYTSRKEGELKAWTKHSYNALLKKEYRQPFENMNLSSQMESNIF
ncbi:hypothetical protein SLE2022_150060 [Rubroshorea leprosula]